MLKTERDASGSAPWAEVQGLVAALSPASVQRDLTVVFCMSTAAPDDRLVVAAERTGRPCIPVSVFNGSVFIGPVYDSRFGVSPHDHSVRLRAAARNNPTQPSIFSVRRPVNAVLLRRAEALYVAAVIQMFLARFDHSPADAMGREIEINLTNLQVSVHPVLPLADSLASDYRGRHEWADLIDARSGIVTHLGGSRVGEVRRATARIADLSVHDSAWVDDRQGFGMAIDQQVDVEHAAVGEILEAYAGAAWGRPLGHANDENACESGMLMNTVEAISL